MFSWAWSTFADVLRYTSPVASVFALGNFLINVFFDIAFGVSMRPKLKR